MRILLDEEVIDRIVMTIKKPYVATTVASKDM